MENKEIIFLNPAFVEKIWGSQKLKSKFNFDIPVNKNIGEAWLVSAHPNGMSYVKNGKYSGLSLKELYETKPEVFGFPQETEFPLLTKILDANDNLSVQIHPDDEYSKKHHNALGKTECWYVLDCKKDQKVVYGHKITDYNKLVKYLDNNQFDNILNYKKIKKGDFIYVPNKKIHGLLAQTMVFELQQSSDITYRLYDYNRVDDKGNPRALHLADSKNNIIVPDIDSSSANGHDNFLVDNQYFKLIKLENKGNKKYNFLAAKWIQATVLIGNGKIDNQEIKIGDSFILPNGYNSFSLEGDLLVMVSYV